MERTLNNITRIVAKKLQYSAFLKLAGYKSKKYVVTLHYFSQTQTHGTSQAKANKTSDTSINRSIREDIKKLVIDPGKCNPKYYSTLSNYNVQTKNS